MVLVLHHWTICLLLLQGRSGSFPIILFWMQWYPGFECDTAKLLVLWYSFSWKFCFFFLMLYSLLFCMAQCILVLFCESEKYFFLSGVGRRNLVLLKHERTQKWDRLLIISNVSLRSWTNHWNFTLLSILRLPHRFIQQANKVAVNIIF